VFDLDGTLIDSALDIAAAANHALGYAGLPLLSVERVKSFVGDGARALVARASGLDENDPRVEPLLAEFFAYYDAHAATFSRPLPGALEALEALASDYPLALATNKARRSTNAALAELGLARYFRVIVAGGDPPRPKPSPEALIFIAGELGLRTNELVMVGDGPQDILAGRAAGARTVGVRGGMASDERLLAAAPEVVIASLAELPAVVADWSARASA
jgi:phosphoglycolate phosphatase